MSVAFYRPHLKCREFYYKDQESSGTSRGGWMLQGRPLIHLEVPRKAIRSTRRSMEIWGNVHEVAEIGKEENRLGQSLGTEHVAFASPDSGTVYVDVAVYVDVKDAPAVVNASDSQSRTGRTADGQVLALS